jgi:hypothetical protein
MAKVFNDILLDDDYDLLIANGDLDVEDSLNQEVAVILSLNQGQLKQHPLIGPNLTAHLKGDVLAVQRKLKMHLAHDNKQLEKFEYKDGRMRIIANNS